MGIAGSGVGASNPRLMFLMVVFLGVIAFGAALYWRQIAIYSQDYVEFTPATHLTEKRPTKPGSSANSSANPTNQLKKELNHE